MARMIPDRVDPASPSSEARVFELLRDDPMTRSWTVYHSLGLSSAYTGAYGEIDFVAMIPGQGLLCIEVKGGRIECRQGVWTTTNRSGETSAYRRSPFLQAREGMFKLVAAIRDRFRAHSPEALCPTGWAVIFTDALAPPSSPEFRREELIDANDLQRGPCALLRASPSLAAAVRSFGEPSVSTLATLAGFLRPDFDRVATLATTMWDAERRFIALTEDQYDVLDHVAGNDAALVTGGAGTGKTMLALELARRLASEGRHVLLSCFNRELGLWLETRSREIVSGHITAGHLHRLLRPRIEAGGLLAEAQASTSETAWFEAGALALSGSDERFDSIIIDEVQDFPAGPLLDLLETWQRQPVAPPGICLFGDFSRQALYGPAEEARALLRQRLHPALFQLRRNCRNTRRIAAETTALTGAFDVKVSDEQPAGPSVERIFFDIPAHQQGALDRALQTLRAEGFNGTDIVILGPRRPERSVVAGLSSCGGYRIVERDKRLRTAGVIYSTIQAFKGLESPAVVLVDLEPRPDHDTDALLYVGMTRARTRLIMILPENCRAEIARRERENLTAALS